MAKIPGTHRSEEEVAFDKHVGSKLRQARILKRLSMEELGKLVDVTYQQIQKYERGTNRIGASRFWRLSKVLEIPVVYFFEGLDERTQQISDGEEVAVNIRRKSMELLGNFYAIEDDKVREALYKLVKDMSKSSKGK